MTLTSEAPATAARETILLRRAGAQGRGTTDLLVRVARESGVGPFRQALGILGTCIGNAKFTAKEYFAYQLYRPDLSRADKRAFLGEVGCYRLNRKLAPPDLTQMRGFIADKIAFRAVIDSLGVPTTRLQAAFALERNLGRLPTLRSAEEIAAFLRGPARYPLFGKPIDGLQAIGSVGVRGWDAASDELELSSGRRVPVTALAGDIAESYPGGFVFEDAIVQHPEMTAVIGAAVGTVRVVTVIAGERPQVLYAVWKIPSPTAMSDNFWQPGSMIALPDQSSGELLRCRRGTGPDTQWIDTHPVSGLPLVGFRLPFWQAALDLAVSTHAIFPTNGILGWDIAIGPDGPLVIEGNENPAHGLYQLPSDRGILAAGFGPILDRVIARNRALKRANFARAKQMA